MVFKQGICTAMITPFKDGKINFDAFYKLTVRQIEAGVHALLLLGTTGENATLSDEERRETVRFFVRNFKGKIPLIFGCGSNNTAYSVETAKRYEDMGADELIAVSPYYNKCTENGLIRYYEALSQAVHIPIIGYFVPSRTGVSPTPNVYKKISRFEHIGGIKDATNGLFLAEHTLKSLSCPLFSGDDFLNFPLLCLGAKGCISVLSNLLPKQAVDFYSDFSNGNFKKAGAFALNSVEVVDALFCEVNPIPIKYALKKLGYDVGTPRPPLTELEDSHKKSLDKTVRKWGET